MKEKTIEELFKDLLFYMVNQKEKCNGVLTRAIEELYKDYNDETKYEIKVKVLKVIYGTDR